MCGITGWVDWNRDLSTEAATAEAMVATMACRGPDDAGLWLTPRAAIGHRRLAVIDVEGGRQPMTAPVAAQGEDPAAVLTFSGEIYNFRELRGELSGRGHRFRTSSDTEVLLAAYLEWGAACVDRLNGMFAFAVWDTRDQELLLVRDRMGIKPLYYYPTATGLMFGSEPKAILANPEFPRELDDEGIAELFTVPVITPGLAGFRGLRSVKPGYLVRVTANGVQERQYWALESHPHTDDLDTTTAHVRELLDDTTRRQMISDVPLCTLLSGGIDSSALTALAAGASDEPIRSFSVEFRGAADDFTPTPIRPTLDSPYVTMAAEHLGTHHQVIELDPAALAEAADIPLRAKDLPGAGDFDISLYLLFAEIRKHATVALSGESADEVFGGYPWYRDEDVLENCTGFPWFNASRRPASLLHEDIAARVRPADYEADRFAEACAEIPRLDGETGRARRLREISYLDLTRQLAIMLDRKDRLSMIVGLEVRVPFCDHRLVEYLWNVPWEIKTVGGIEKGLLRRAAAGLLPDEITWRPKSAYPATKDPGYAKLIDAATSELLADPGAPLFDLVDRQALRTAVDNGHTVPATSAPFGTVGPYYGLSLSYLLDINAWLRDYRVRLV